VKAANVRLPRDEKLSQQCAILADVVLRLRGLYQDASRAQRDLLETIIGAAIWYLPECDGLFTGKISMKALEACRQDAKQWPKLTKEHFYPRKRSGADLLQDKTPELTGADILAGFKEKWGRYHRVTKHENRALVSLQRKGISPDDCYATLIELVEVPPELMKRTRRKSKF